MILTKEELAELDAEIDTLLIRLTQLRTKKITSLVLFKAERYFGDIELGRSILVDKDGKRYVLADLKTQIDVNYDNHSYYSYCSLLVRAIKRNGELSKNYNYVNRPEDYTVTGETL